MPGWLLKLCAFAVTGLAALGSAAYVGGHLKNPHAPLAPPVIASSPAGGHLHLEPSVQASGGQDPVTFTSVS